MGKTEDETNLKEFTDILAEAKHQILMFSGNFSFTNLKNEKTIIFNAVDALVKKGITIRAVSRVDIAGKKNTEQLLALNFKYGKERIEVHPCICVERAILARWTRTFEPNLKSLLHSFVTGF